MLGVPILRISELPTWESKNKITFGCNLYVITKKFIRGKVVASSISGSW
jgi:hypothetical protein